MGVCVRVGVMRVVQERDQRERERLEEELAGGPPVAEHDDDDDDDVRRRPSLGASGGISGMSPKRRLPQRPLALAVALQQQKRGHSPSSASVSLHLPAFLHRESKDGEVSSDGKHDDDDEKDLSLIHI